MIYLRSIGAFVAGMAVAAAVNFGLILLGPLVIAVPDGFDNSSQQAVMETVHLLEARHFIFPLLAHALGTLAGVWLGALLAHHKLVVGVAVGALSFAGGIANVIALPGPTWFEVLDLLVCYVPMTWLGYRLATRDGTA